MRMQETFLLLRQKMKNTKPICIYKTWRMNKPRVATTRKWPFSDCNIWLRAVVKSRNMTLTENTVDDSQYDYV
jgi:hypothetical protein